MNEHDEDYECKRCHISMFLADPTYDRVDYCSSCAQEVINEQNARIRELEIERYIYLKKGDIVQEGDEAEVSNGWNAEAKWQTVTSGGRVAPDPQYPAHTIYRRTKGAEIARLEARVKELEDWQARAVEKLHELQSTRTEGFVPSLAWKDTQELIKEAEGSEG